MTKGILLDSVAVSDLMGSVSGVREQLSVFDTIYISPIVIGETLFAYENSARRDQNRSLYAAISELWIKLPVTARTADLFAQIRKSQQKKGLSIPLHDIWIAATALEYDLPLLTRDAHFNSVDDLTVISWGFRQE